MKRPDEALVVFKSTWFIQQRCFSITYLLQFNRFFFFLNKHLLHTELNKTQLLPLRSSPSGWGGETFAKRKLILILIVILILTPRAKSTICKTVKNYHKQSQGAELCVWYATFWIYKEKNKNCQFYLLMCKYRKSQEGHISNYKKSIAIWKTGKRFCSCVRVCYVTLVVSNSLWPYGL